MDSHRHALIVMGALFQAQSAASLVDTARAEGTQVVFAGAIEGVTPRFPDWVIEVTSDDPFDGTNLAAQLRAVGIGQLRIAGPESAVVAARTHGFGAEAARIFA